MSVCAWCGQTIASVLGTLSGQPAQNFGMCRDCLDAHLAALPHPLGSRELKRARRMRRCGKSLWHIGQVLGVSQPTVRAALHAA